MDDQVQSADSIGAGLGHDAAIVRGLSRLNTLRRRVGRHVPALLALALTALAYAGTLSYEFVYDDTQQIVGNRYLTSWRFVPHYFTEHVWGHQNPNTQANYYRPLFLLWLHINYSLFGLQPRWWHLAAVAAHVGVTLLVYALVLRVTKDSFAAGVAALLFGLHPVHVEAVAWVSGVTEPLLALALIPSFLCYLNSRERRHHRGFQFAASLVLYGLAMLAKETALVLPLMIFAYELWVVEDDQAVKRVTWGGRIKASIIKAGPYLLLSLCYLAVRMLVLKGVAHALTPLPLQTIILTCPSLLWFYVRLLVWPVGLSVFYDTPYVTAPTLAEFVLPVVALFVLAAVLWSWSRRSRAARFALIWLALPIIPVLNISVFYEGELAHDRYLYLPSVGFAMLVALAVRRLAAGRAKLLGQPAPQVVVALVLACLLNQATVRQTAYWADNFSLYSRGMSVAPNNFLAINNLGTALAKRKQYQAAIDLYLRALARKPFYWSANCNLGYSYYQLGRFAEAERYLERAIEIYPGDARQYLCLGMARMKMGRLEEAAATLRHAISLRPEGSDYHYALGSVLEQQGDLTGAVNEFRLELANTPEHRGAQKQLAAVAARLAGSGNGELDGREATLELEDIDR